MRRNFLAGIVAKGMDGADRGLLLDEGYLFYDIFELIEDYG